MERDPQIDAQPEDAWRERLKQAIDDRRLSYKALSEKAGFNGEYVSRMLNGRINPTVDKILTICRIANIDPVFLFSGTTSNKEMREVVEAAFTLSEREANLVSRLLQSARSE